MRTLRPLLLMLPALAPSWRFFDAVAPSPRIHYRLLGNTHAVQDWQEFRPRPEQVTVSAMFKRLFWNAQWNETLFMTSCAERILEHYTTHSEDEILLRIQRTLTREQQSSDTHLQFRLLLVTRQGQRLTSSEAFVSRLQALDSA